MPRRRKKVGRGVDATGRSLRQAPFVKLDHALIDSDAWQHLSPRACKLLIAIWRRHNGVNNGQICFSQREAMSLLRCNSHTAIAAFNELIDKGFLILERDSAFNVKTREARRWRLTAERAGDHHPTRDFRHWTPKKTTRAVAAPHRCRQGTRERDSVKDRAATGAVAAPVRPTINTATGAPAAPVIIYQRQGERLDVFDPAAEGAGAA